MNYGAKQMDYDDMFRYMNEQTQLLDSFIEFFNTVGSLSNEICLHRLTIQ